MCPKCHCRMADKISQRKLSRQILRTTKLCRHCGWIYTQRRHLQSQNGRSGDCRKDENVIQTDK
jgi:hypothetical protein